MDQIDLLLARESASVDADRVLRLRCERGELTRVVRGVYTSTDRWLELDTMARYRLRIRAIASLHPQTQFSHQSAAAMWALPMLGAPAAVHARVPREPRLKSSALVRRHAIGRDSSGVVLGGIQITSLAATLADACTLADRAAALCIVDAGLRGPEEWEPPRPTPSRRAVLRALEGLGSAPGTARGRRLLEFADPKSASPGESVARLQLRAIGMPPAELQHRFDDPSGLIGYADFFWPDLGLVAEFDGDVKYGAERRFARDRPASQLLIDEKRREDRLRALGLSVVRLDWSTVWDRERLRIAFARWHPRTKGSFRKPSLS